MAELFSHGRTALKYGLIKFEFRAGDKILIPDYICNVVIQPLDALKLDYVFYPMDDKLCPDWAILEALCKQNKISALMMVHYFGQAQNIKKFVAFSQKNNLILIEDNAHGYGGKINGIELGTIGDIGFSSPRKNLEIPFGGILYIKGKIVLPPTDILRYRSQKRKYQIKKLLKSFPIITNNIIGIMVKARNKGKVSIMEPKYSDMLADFYSINYFQKVEMSEICSIRRKNWNLWASFCIQNNLSPVFSQLNKESCPWAFPILTENIEIRDKWLKWGKKHGISAFTWPNLPEIILQNNDIAVNRWRRLVCFPLNQKPPKY